MYRNQQNRESRKRFRDDGGRNRDNWRSNSGSRNNGPNKQKRLQEKPYDKWENNYRSNHQEDNNKFAGPRKMDLKMIQELIEDNDLEKIIFILSDNRKGFKELLNDTDQSPDTTVLLVNLISKACESAFHESKTLVLTSIIDSHMFQAIVRYISTLGVQNNRDKKRNFYFWKDPDHFWKNVINMCKTFNNLLPSTSCDNNLKILKTIKMNIPIIEEYHSIHISDNIKLEVANLCEIIEKTTRNVGREKEEKGRGYVMDEEDLEPPENFREISVYPNATELISRQEVFLRCNVVKGPYRDVEHYLDVQYRLLREDFVLPLRNGICKYIDNNNSKLDDIKIFPQVKFLNMETLTEQNCYRIQFDFSKNKKAFNYENSKRLMFGSLLCFTADKFKTIIFGKIVERKIEVLEKGQLVVGFSEDVVLPENLYNLTFLMVESKVYFEPYYQVLNVLKSMPTADFPMERYIIKVETETRPPKYLLQINPVYYAIEGKTFFPLEWENQRFYSLNDAQSEAFKAALTREFAIIQGPPGTGKTFLGLKIAHTLLNNMTAWYKNSPMLVICFTNHALDQFLEGLLPVTNKIIRIGGQSKNEKVNAFNIRGRKYRQQAPPAIFQKRLEVRNYLQEIGSINEYLTEIERNTSILDFSVFGNVVENFNSSWFAKVDEENIFSWLMEDGNSQMAYGRKAATLQADAGGEVVQVDNENHVEPEDVDNLEPDVNEVQDEIFQDIDVAKFKELVSLKSLRDKIFRLRKERIYIQHDDQLNPQERYILTDKIDLLLYVAEDHLNMLRFRLEEGKKMKMNIGPPDFINLENPYFMPPDLRWHMYFYWVKLYENRLRQKKEALIEQFRQVYVVHNQMRDMEDTQIMKSALVIGMTTTGAARLQSSLQALKSPIVIVEEAAEVLESHIIAALTPHCKHLILIGDHQQLKPSTANFKIETDFLLGISLFERMVGNNIQCHTLNIQHRMRPEIANLVRPSIYPALEDHESVFDRPHILGVEHDLFFIDHNHKEQMCNDNSKKNIHESKLMVQLARHLILNGYKPENIIILAAYLGQMFEMRKEKKLYSNLLQDVRIAVLDNYQGEESDIVLLSLVRSNEENRIGFLKIENRVCVALSRARNGFYITGNMKQLCRNSEIWPKVQETLKNQNAIGSHLTLRCQIHRHRITNVSTAEDFARLPEGGCDLLCESPLMCGHVCKRLCHIEDREHANYNCQVTCEKLLCENPQHKCRKFCYQECGPCFYPVERHLNCGHTVNLECHLDPEVYKCIVEVDTELPCTHRAMKPCHVDKEKFQCLFPCDIRVDCGHACVNTCHIRIDPDHLEYKCRKPCQKNANGCTAAEPHICKKRCFEKCIECTTPVQKKRTKCVHMYTVPCSMDPDDIVCEKLCKKMLPCGHRCKNKCFEPCGNCEFMVKKIVPDCNHEIKIKCYQEPTRKFCNEVCPRLLPCGHVCGKKCKEDCRTRCKEIVNCNISSPCGHTITEISCYIKNNHDDKSLLENCTKKCDFELKCKHKCSGTCGQCYQGRFHQRCQEKCGVTLVCNHECQVPCREACQPCRKPCEYRCAHSKCNRLCGDYCTRCKEFCKRACQHQRCKNSCGQICSVSPCEEPCRKKLKCRHNCVGFCGEPCPKLCRICNQDELKEIFFGTEDEEDARFVLLEDCGHIMESTGMINWLEQQPDKDEEIKPVVCPKCKTFIKKTARYSDYVKASLEDLKKVKIRFHGSPKEIENTRIQLNNKLSVLALRLASVNRELLDIVQKLKSRLDEVKNKRKQIINKMDLDSLRMKTELIEVIRDLIENETSFVINFPRANKHVTFIASLLSKNIDSVTQQEADDVMLEMDRLNRWIQFEKINCRYHLQLSSVKTMLEMIPSLLSSPQRFSEKHDKEIKEKLEELKKLTASTIALTDAEKREIVKAVGLTKGHWYKCRNGHPYAIGECGGAMQQSTCYECGAPIGGSHHRLVSDNRVASEMDGASHAAWSEQANLNNYQL